MRKFFYKHNSRSAEKIQVERLELIRKEGALTEDEATLAVYSRKVQTLAGLLLALHPQIEAYEKRIKELFRTHPDAPVFSGIPGAGDALSPRLLCAFGTDRARFEMPRNMTQWNGSAPVTISSGQDKRSGQPKRVVTWRWGAPTFIRQTFVEFAKHSTRNCDWAKAFYQIKEEEGQPCQTISFKFFEPWPSNGPAFFFDAGKMVRATTSKIPPIAPAARLTGVTKQLTDSTSKCQCPVNRS